MVVWAALTLAAGGCIQRKLYCPPVNAMSGSPQGAGVDLGGTGGLRAFVVNGEKDGDKDKVAVNVVPVTGQPFPDALRAEIKQSSGHEWAVQVQAANVAPVQEGDVLLATFHLRADKPLEDQGVVQTQFVFEEAQSPYAKSVTYDVLAGPDWREVHVPFVARASYPTGGAHMIFRLGYDPETLEIGGVRVENFGQKVHLAALPTTRPWTPPKRAQGIDLPPTEGGPLALEVDVAKTIGPISPYVYGINSQSSPGTGVTVRRMGGNRQTAYNWEINASNAGSDYQHQSDEWPCTTLGYTNCGEPAAQFLDFVADNKKIGAATIATVSLVDYVAADKGQAVSEADKAPSKRWDKSLPHKPGAYSATPDLADGVVYEDEFVDFLVHKLGKAADGGIQFYSLDNEPALWPSTHPRIHSAKTTYREMVARTEALASGITTIDPTATLLGGVMFGWSEYQNLSDAPDAKEVGGQYETYVDYYLASMKQLEQKYHRRLVHDLDVHWYPEARGTKRITDDDNSPKTVEARLQAPRALWDPTYREKSWIDDALKGKSIRLVRWLEEKIGKQYPGTKLSMTEYDFGGATNISGSLAQADVLGVLGREGVFMANYWGNGPGNGPLPQYIGAAFKLYRNYDGKGGTYGDTAVTTSVPDLSKASVFAAADSKHPGRLTIVAINKDLRAKFAGTIAIRGATKYTAAQVYRVDRTGPEVRAIDPNVAIRDNRIEYALPPLSATLFVCEAH
jgi:Glycoside hydrolase family 44